MASRTPVILGLDCAAGACSAAVWRDGAVAAHLFQPMARGHAEALMPMAVAAMDQAGLAGQAGFAALDAVAATVGPGSFTGLRIALAAARGLRLAHGTPFVGVTSLAAVAAGVPPAERAGTSLLVALDSKRGDVFAQLFDAELRPLREAAALASAELAAYAGSGPLTIAGDAVEVARAALATAGPAVRVAGGSGVPDAAQVVELAARLIAENGGRAEGAGLPATPLYLRPPDVTLPPEAARAGGVVPEPATLRETGPFDLQILAALHAACFADCWSADAMAALLATPGTFALLALVEGQPAGFVMARVAAQEAEVLSLCVLLQHRRRGIGRSLLTEAGERARGRGAETMFLEVAEDDAGARRFYDAAGFVPVGRRPGYYRRAGGARAAALVLRRQLGHWSQPGQETLALG